MPSMFSESDETQFQGLIKGLKDNIVGDKYLKTYDSCRDKAELSDPIDCSTPKRKKSYDSSPSQVYISEDLDEDSVVETTALKHISEPSKSSSNDAIMADGYLTVPGTIKKGKKKGQSVEVVLNMSREELEILESNIKMKRSFLCNAKTGIGFHVFLWTVLCFPFSIIVSGIYSFGMGTITWYNVFKLFSEKKAVAYKIVFPPLLILLYPFLIISISLGLGLYAGVKQLSCSWDLWLKEFTDYEKGFYAWLCNFLDIPECCPYEVVILSSVHKS